MCISCILRCPKCDTEVEGVYTLYQCLRKLQYGFNDCDKVIKMVRRMTPTEMVLTATSCCNAKCDLSVVQQLIQQLNIWHAVQTMDKEQRAEQQFQVADHVLRQRATIRKHGRGSQPLDLHPGTIPLVAGALNSPPHQRPRIPNPHTLEDTLLKHALIQRRQAMVTQVQASHQVQDKNAFWRQRVKDAVALAQRVTFWTTNIANVGELDNDNPIALEDEYKMFCCLDNTPPVLLWAPVNVHGNQSGSLQPSGQGNTPGSGSASVGNQLNPALVNNSSAATATPSLHGPPMVPSFNMYGQPSWSENPVTHPSQLSSAPAVNVHNFNNTIQRPSNGLMQQSSGLSHPAVLDSSRQAPLLEYYSPPGPLGYYPPPGPSSGSNFPAHQARGQASSSTHLVAPSQGDSGSGSSSIGSHMPRPAGQMQTTQSLSQFISPASDQYHFTAHPPTAGMSVLPAQTAANMYGPPQPGVSALPQYASTPAASGFPGPFATQNPDVQGISHSSPLLNDDSTQFSDNHS